MNLITKYRAKRAETLISRANASNEKWEQSGDRRDLDEAIMMYSRSLPYLAKLRDKALPHVFKKLGFCFGDIKDFHNAKRAFETATHFLPNDLESWLNLASCNAILSDDGEVRACLQQAFWLVADRASAIESIVPFIRDICYNDIADQWEARAQELRVRICDDMAGDDS